MAKHPVLGAFSQTAHLKPRTQRQICDVYLTLASTAASSMAGYYTAERLLFIESFSLLLSLGLLALSAGVYLMPATSQNLTRRRAMLWSIGWISGAVIQPTIAPFINYGYADAVYMALGMTVALFGSFGAAVMSSTRSQVVYAVGAAMFAITSLSWVSLLNWFYPTQMLSNMSLMTGLAVPCVSVVVHTSTMLEQASRGQDIDPIVHALRFFNDLVQIFVHLLALFSSDKQRRQEEEEQGRKGRRTGRRSSGRQFYAGSYPGGW